MSGGGGAMSVNVDCNKPRQRMKTLLKNDILKKKLLQFKRQIEKKQSLLAVRLSDVLIYVDFLRLDTDYYLELNQFIQAKFCLHVISVTIVISQTAGILLISLHRDERVVLHLKSKLKTSYSGCWTSSLCLCSLFQRKCVKPLSHVHDTLALSTGRAGGLVRAVKCYNYTIEIREL